MPVDYMKHIESVKRIMVLLLGAIGLAMQTGVYAWYWFSTYYPILNEFRKGPQDQYMGRGLVFVHWGHVYILAFYFALLLILSNAYGGLKIGYLKPMDVFLSQIFILFIVNFITYALYIIIKIGFVDIVPMIEMLLIQLALSFVWAYITNFIYMSIFPPRKLLLINGEYAADDIIAKFNTRKDKYRIIKKVNISEGIDKIYKYEHDLRKYLIDRLSELDFIEIYNKNNQAAIIAFNIKGVFSQDAAIYLDKYNICVRAGNHCAKMVKDEIKIKNTCRISLYFYNTKEEVDKFIEVMKGCKDIFKVII